jgi:pimeloyl-ACP methyl ester carboxylesterase
MTVETLVADVCGMVRAVCERLKVRQVDVLGFSLGASLALLACAGDSLPVRSLTCVGPDVDLLESERFALDFAIAEAGRRHHRRALKELGALGAPPHTDVKKFVTRVKWVSNFGGVDRRKTFWGLFRDNLGQLWRSPRYSVGEVLGALKAMSATSERMLPALVGFNLMARPLPVETPVCIFQGRHDVAAPPRLAVILAEHLNAPLVWFEDSAHIPHHEEPDRFRKELLRFVGGVANRPSIRSG